MSVGKSSPWRGLAVPVIFFLLAFPAPAYAGVLHAFKSDGCSLFPDGDLADRELWCDCCLNHDIAYWQGGSRADRKQADESLRQCVLARTGSKVLAGLMYDGVRAGGHPAFPTWYRWGYGWNYGRGYTLLTESEQRQVGDKLVEYYTQHPSGYCLEKKNNVK